MDDNETSPEQESAVQTVSDLNSGKPLIKYLAMIMVIALPFLGGWVGYQFAPLKVIEVERIVTVDEQDSNTKSLNENNVETTAAENANGNTLWNDVRPHDHFLGGQGFFVQTPERPYKNSWLITVDGDQFAIEGTKWLIDQIGTSSDEQAKVDLILKKIYDWAAQGTSLYQEKTIYGPNTTRPGGEVVTYARVDEQTLRVLGVDLSYDDRYNTVRMIFFMSQPVSIQYLLANPNEFDLRG